MVANEWMNWLDFRLPLGCACMYPLTWRPAVSVSADKLNLWEDINLLGEIAIATLLFTPISKLLKSPEPITMPNSSRAGLFVRWQTGGMVCTTLCKSNGCADGATFKWHEHVAYLNLLFNGFYFNSLAQPACTAKHSVPSISTHLHHTTTQCMRLQIRCRWWHCSLLQVFCFFLFFSFSTAPYPYSVTLLSQWE